MHSVFPSFTPHSWSLTSLLSSVGISDEMWVSETSKLLSIDQETRSICLSGSKLHHSEWYFLLQSICLQTSCLFCLFVFYSSFFGRGGFYLLISILFIYLFIYLFTTQMLFPSQSPLMEFSHLSSEKMPSLGIPKPLHIKAPLTLRPGNTFIETELHICYMCAGLLDCVWLLVGEYLCFK